MDEIYTHISMLEELTGKHFGSRENPLLVSVRSGNPRWAYNCYRRFIQMYFDVVMEVGKQYFEELIEKMK